MIAGSGHCEKGFIMRYWIRRIVIVTALIGVGWSMGRAQAQAPIPDFELSVDIPVGSARIECVRGCALVGARDAAVPNVLRKPYYTFSCSGPGQERCAARVHGFVQQ